MTTISFIKASKEQAHIVQNILEEAPQYSLNSDGIHPSPSAAKETLETLPHNCELSQKHVFIVEVDQSPVGVIDLIDGFPNSETAFVGLFVLSERVQRRGLGREIYRYLENRVLHHTPCKRIRLAVVDSNPVVPFWQKMGFHLTDDPPRPHEGVNLKSLKRIMQKELRR